ncbi:hypothetical protein JCM19236_2879 [Vibrio sp. JCM 19236]|nr:hypothetical protein JCM19236_2879 [Vibrio sp. JCM 19236]
MEMAIITPVLLIIMMGIFEVTQVIQANNIIISLSREGANIIARNSSQTPEEVMDIVASTSNPLDMVTDGAMFISQVVAEVTIPVAIHKRLLEPTVPLARRGLYDIRFDMGGVRQLDRWRM